jgi:hypothetical protein
MIMADKPTPPPPPPPTPGIGLPEFSYPGRKPLDVRLLEFIFGGREKPS